MNFSDKVFIKKDKMIADVEIIDFQKGIVKYHFPDIDIYDMSKFDEVEFMKETGKKDLFGSDILEGHVLFNIGNPNYSMIGIKNFNANGSCPYRYWDKLYGFHHQNRMSWEFAMKSVIIGTVWDDLDILKENAMKILQDKRISYSQ